MNDRILTKALKDLSFSKAEIDFYLASYHSGADTIPNLAKLARIKRSNAYLVASELTEKGLLYEDLQRYGKKIVATEPKDVLRRVLAKQRSIGRTANLLQENLEALQADYQASTPRPKVRTFQGLNGFVAVWKDILSSKTELLLWTNQEDEQKIFNQSHHDQFISERCRKNIHIRVLAINNKKGEDLIKNDSKLLRQTKLLDKSVNFSTETYIYEDKIAMLDHNKDVIGIIIQSEQIANAQRAIFEQAWKVTK